jgi:hypothetical protein
MLIDKVFVGSAVKIISVSFFLIFVPACASGPDYILLDKQINEGNCQLASKSIDEKSYGLNMRLNFLLDSALINMRCGNYEESNGYFHEADELAEKLWTKSLSREAASFLINDYTIPYVGEDFEKVFINLFSAINYVLLENFDEALVECRRLDSLLTLYNDKYEKKNVYKEDAFGRYLSGLIYEAEGQVEDAYIDYYKAYQTFQDYEKKYGTITPSFVVADLIRASKAAGRQDEVASLLTTGLKSKEISLDKSKGKARVVLIHLNGKSPLKKESKVIIPTPNGPLAIAFPRYEVTEPNCSKSRLIVKSDSYSNTSSSELVEDINKIAVEGLNDRKARIIAKTLARAAAKQLVMSQLTKDDNVKKLMNLLNTLVVERADTRSWRTLPGEIYMSTQFVPEGRHSISVDYCGTKNYLKDVTVTAGETKFLLFDTIY